MREPNDLAKQFARELKLIRDLVATDAKADIAAEKLHVSTTGAMITGLYENIRKSTENAATSGVSIEESALFAPAIRRFFKRFFLVQNSDISNIGEELIIELTLAGYLKNDSVSIKTVEKINKIIRDYAIARKKLMVKFPSEIADRWTLDPMSVAIASQLVDNRLDIAFTDFAYNYFLNNIDAASLFAHRPIASFEATLFMAVQKILLKSSPAEVRLNLIERYQISPRKTVDFAKINTQIDQILSGPNFDRLTQVIDRHGASFRIVLSRLNDENLPKSLESEKEFTGLFNSAITETYFSVAQEVNRGVLLSIIFISVMRFLVFIATEVPFALIDYNNERWLPLIVNLLLPSAYMLALRLTLSMPRSNNSRSLNRRIIQILFEKPPPKPSIGRVNKRFSATYNIIYTILISGILFGLGYILVVFMRFNWFDLLKLFFFLSKASFLGFRLSRKIRNIEVGDESQSGVTVLRDFFYMPFVIIGRKVNEIYSRFNPISNLLDVLIELPLKTVLGFIRRWGMFISHKKDSF